MKIIDLVILSTKISCDNFVLMPSYTFMKDFIVETKRAFQLIFKTYINISRFFLFFFKYFLEHDMELLQKLKNFQNQFNDDVQILQETEANFGKKLGEFMMVAKQILPVNMLKIKTVKEFETIVKVAKGTPRAAKKLEIIDKYFDIVKKLRSVLTEIEAAVCLPLLQMHKVCETERQREVKPQIQTLAKETLQKLRADADLQKVSHPGWGKRLLKSEHDLFLGLLSLVPIGTEAAFDINCLLDEYINDFPL